ncbi:MAG TPA: putative sulfate exporter family transporter [Bacteroidales bacterium]|nr:putative sulfate exporter family transporter [Bacteroidales bacterium]
MTAWAGFSFPSPKFGWSNTESFTGLLAEISNYKAFLGLAVLLILVGSLTLFLKKKSFSSLVAAIVVMFVISLVSMFIAGYKPIKYYGFEYVIFALLLGIAVRNIFGLPKWIEDNLHTEFFVKTGLVVLGSGIIFGDIVKAGSLGLVQALVVVVVVWFFAYWIAKKLKVDDELSLMLSSAVSICGVSAAIATAGAIKGDGKKLSYVVSLVLIVALPMLFLMPLAAKYLGLNPAQAGAWFGGTIDTTGAVVASGALLGEEALKYCTIIKFSQNVLIGFAAVAISIFWVLKERKELMSTETKKADFGLIWSRFPKFVLGFMLVSVIFSFLVSPADVAASKDYLKSSQTAFFASAFVGIGLETDFSVLVKTGNGRPAWAFVIAQLFNVLFTLIVAYFLFSSL